ncbi:hypothetical protein [Desulfovibrio ferrophilus]|uniref:Putative rtx toxin rtxa n=1 Tax=Desulfovibrio ferrophilus TaxID=241368 RepID=A0A2Z6AZS0_9BACT|nr:hypothetical protein [Desulfovibrio ferrophilus]BBD08771.1 putative rtx toxin rtxa [Desulfovibrio ferrophilus]
MDNIIQKHIREMKALRNSLKDSSKQLHEQRRQNDLAVVALKRRIADIPLTVPKARKPIHSRILSFIF